MTRGTPHTLLSFKLRRVIYEFEQKVLCQFSNAYYNFNSVYTYVIRSLKMIDIEDDVPTQSCPAASHPPLFLQTYIMAVISLYAVHNLIQTMLSK